VITCSQLKVFLWYEIQISHTGQVGFLSQELPFGDMPYKCMYIISVQAAMVTLGTRMGRSFRER